MTDTEYVIEARYNGAAMMATIFMVIFVIFAGIFRWMLDSDDWLGGALSILSIYCLGPFALLHIGALLDKRNVLEIDQAGIRWRLHSETKIL